jgi:hypothetical protein
VENVEIGKPTRVIVVEPLKDPVPREEPKPDPERLAEAEPSLAGGRQEREPPSR